MRKDVAILSIICFQIPQLEAGCRVCVPFNLYPLGRYRQYLEFSKKESTFRWGEVGNQKSIPEGTTINTWSYRPSDNYRRDIRNDFLFCNEYLLDDGGCVVQIDILCLGT